MEVRTQEPGLRRKRNRIGDEGGGRRDQNGRLTPVVKATPSMLFSTSVTDRVGGHVVFLSEGDLYSNRRTLLTAVERTVAVFTDVRNLAAPG